MTIIIRLDVMMAKKKIRSNQLADAIGITEANLSLLKNGKIKGVKLETRTRYVSLWIASPATCWNSRVKRPRPWTMLPGSWAAL